MSGLRERAAVLWAEARARFWPAVKPALFTAMWTFLGIFSASLIGYLDDVAGWFEAFGTPEASEFPDPSTVGEAFVAGVMAAVAGLTSFVARMLGLSKPPEYR